MTERKHKDASAPVPEADQEDGDQKRECQRHKDAGNDLHGSCDLCADQQRIDLGKGFRGALAVISFGCHPIHVVRDRQAIAGTHQAADIAVPEEIDLPLLHIDHEQDTAFGADPAVVKTVSQYRCRAFFAGRPEHGCAEFTQRQHFFPQFFQL